MSSPADCCPQLAPEKLSCWHRCDRSQASQLLLSGACRPGTFLLRPCHSRAEKYALSVLQETGSGFIFGRRRRQQPPVVRNYLIKEKVDGSGYCIFSGQCFQEVHQLIEYYGQPRRRMHTVLRFPFPRMAGSSADVAADTGGGGAARKLRADKGRQIHLLTKIGSGSYEMYSAELNGARVVSLVLDGGQEISASMLTAAAASEKAPPPLPPRGSMPTAPEAAGKMKPPSLLGDLQGQQLCVPKKASSGGSDGSWAAVARSHIDRCGRLAESLLLRLFK